MAATTLNEPRRVKALVSFDRGAISLPAVCEALFACGSDNSGVIS